MHNAKIRTSIERYDLEWADVARKAGLTLPEFVREMNCCELSPTKRKRVENAVEKLRHVNDKQIYGAFRYSEMYRETGSR